jgi:IS5 family transposase
MTEGRINIIDATPVEAAQSGRGKDANDESALYLSLETSA